MLETYLRPLYQRILVNPIMKYLLHYSSITPCLVTVIGCIIGIVSAVMLAYQWKYIGIVLLLLSGYLDTVDGTLARYRKKTSSFGTALDIICDRIVECAVVISFYSIHTGYLTLFMLGAILICITTFLVVGIFIDNETDKGFHYSHGLIERGEAFLFFVAMILVPQYFHILAILFILLVGLTAAIRIMQFQRYCVMRQIN